MKVLGCGVLLVLVLPISAVSKSLSDVNIVKDTPLLPQDLKNWKDSYKEFVEMKKVAVRSVECSNIAPDCHCNYLKLLGGCGSQKFRSRMTEECAATCGACVGESIGSQCHEKYVEICKKLADHGFHRKAQFRYLMACACPKASGICETEPTSLVELATPAPTLKAIDVKDECLRLQNEKRILHGAAALTWCPKCAEFAQKLVEKMQNLDKPRALIHSSREERTWLVDSKFVTHGENMQGGFPQVDCAMAVKSWDSESEFYDPDHPKESIQSAGHFTQMVWKNTQGVGCAQTKNYLACIYEPTGNTKNAYKIKKNVQP